MILMSNTMKILWRKATIEQTVSNINLYNDITDEEYQKRYGKKEVPRNSL